MNLLVIQVSTNQLSMEEYLQKLKVGIEEERKFALYFKRKGKLDLAKKALQRSKIMKQEIEEAESQQ